MKAMVYHEYGPPEVLRLREIEKPALKDDQILVKIQAASINWLDWHFLTGKPYLARVMAGLIRPKYEVLGIDLAGQVEAVGANVTQFKEDDEVFGSSSHGCFAEYVSVSEENIVAKPTNQTFDAAAAVPGAAIPALQALRDHGNLQPGQKALINGASGGVGTFAVQIARSLGAEVTGVCSAGNLELVRSIGARRAIDYTQEDFARDRASYDLIFDVAAKRSFSDCERALKEGGIYITSEFSPALAIRGRWTSSTRSKKMVPLPPKPPSKTDLILMRELLESGKVRPVIDRCYPLSEVPEALEYLERGHARGKIVIRM